MSSVNQGFSMYLSFLFSPLFPSLLFVNLAGLPYLEGVIDAAGGKAGAVGGPGNGGDIACMALVDTDGISGDGIPHLNCFVVTSRGYEMAVRRPGSAVHAAKGIAMEKACSLGDGVPELHRFVVAGGGDAPAIGRPGNACYFLAMTAVDVYAALVEEKRGEEVAAGISGPFPDLNGAVIGGGSDVLSVRRPGQCRDPVSMAVKGEEDAPGRDLPDLNRVICASGGDAGAIG